MSSLAKGRIKAPVDRFRLGSSRQTSEEVKGVGAGCIYIYTHSTSEGERRKTKRSELTISAVAVVALETV